MIDKMNTTAGMKPFMPTTNKVLRPRDSASLLLVDRNASTPRILMGKRHASLAFMPGMFVFPGGRADAIDGSITAASELNPDDMRKLLTGMGSRASQRRARALGLCAIRETFEETGLRIYGDATTPLAKLPEHQDWRAFLQPKADSEPETCLLPALGNLRYFARAVTPPRQVRRFDTRFFIAFRDTLPNEAAQELIPSGELEDLDWVPLDQVDKLPMAPITPVILNEARSLLLDCHGDLPTELPVTHISFRNMRFVRKVI